MRSQKPTSQISTCMGELHERLSNTAMSTNKSAENELSSGFLSWLNNVFCRFTLNAILLGF